MLRSGPQAFPRSGLLVGMLLPVYVLLDLYSGFVSGLYDPVVLLAEAALDTVMLTVFCYLVLLCWHQRARFQQTFSAMLGTGALLMVVSLPLLSAAHFESWPVLGQLVAWMLLILFLWNIVVTAHILKHALDHVLYAPILLAGPYQLLNFMVLTLLFQRK